METSNIGALTVCSYFKLAYRTVPDACCSCAFAAGPVAAAYKAIDQLYDLDHVPELTEYTVNSLTEGIEALVTTRWGSCLRSACWLCLHYLQLYQACCISFAVSGCQHVPFVDPLPRGESA